MGIFENFMQRWRSPSTAASIQGVDGEDEIPNNPSGMDFLDSARSSIRRTVDKYSVVQNSLTLSGADRNAMAGRMSSPFGSAGIINPGSDVDTSFASSSLGLAIPVDTNKVQRIQSYDNIARYPELDWCIGEIANDFVHEDVDGDFIKLKIRSEDGKYSNGEDKVLQYEFKQLVSKFDIRSNGYNMMRKFVIEGELCFENVIDPNHPEYGIIGERYVPNIYYDFLKDSRTGQVCGLFLDPERIKTLAQYGGFGAGNMYNGQSTTVFNAVRQYPAYSYTYSVSMKDKIIMPWEQVTYMNSGVLSDDGSVVFPAIERVVVPTRQLLLLHDAMVILRITRAPERLVFNLDMTGLSPKDAKREVRKFMEERRQKKAVVGSGAVTNVYNAETMLDAYYFWKTSEASGARVENLNSTVHYNEMNDVEYFLHRILKFMNIPWARWSESQANRQDKNSILNEEFSFAQMIVRIQQLFASAVKKTFITHLRLRGLFDKFDVNESDFDVIMNTPALYEMYQAQQRLNSGIEILNNTASLDFLSKNLMLKKVLCWTDSEIRENEVNVRREALFKAQTEFMAQSIGQAGTPTAGKVWLDPDKYLNPPPTNPTGTDVNGDAPMPPPGGEGGAPIPPPGAEGDGMEAPMPPPGGEGGAPMPPDMGAAAPQPPPAEGGSQPLEIPEPSIPEVDDSGTTKAEKELKTNPEFGEFEKKSKDTETKMEKQYPETEDGLKALEKGTDVSLKSIFDRNFGDELDSKRTLKEIFASEFGTDDGSKKYLKSLSSIFSDEFGGDKEEGEVSMKEPASDRPLTSVFKDVFVRKRPLQDIFNDELG